MQESATSTLLKYSQGIFDQTVICKYSKYSPTLNILNGIFVEYLRNNTYHIPNIPGDIWGIGTHFAQ